MSLSVRVLSKTSPISDVFYKPFRTFPKSNGTFFSTLPVVECEYNKCFAESTYQIFQLEIVSVPRIDYTIYNITPSTNTTDSTQIY